LPQALARQAGYEVHGLLIIAPPFNVAAGFPWQPCPDVEPPALPRQIGYEVHTLEPSLITAPPADSWDNQRPGPFPAVLPRQIGFEVHTFEPSLYKAPPANSWDNQRPDPLPAAPARQAGHKSDPLESSLYKAPPPDSWDNQRPDPLPPALARQLGLFTQSPAPVAAGVQGPNFPSAAQNGAESGAVAWTNPGNIKVEDGVNATAAVNTTISQHGSSKSLFASNFGFAIPAGATITGIKVEWKQAGTGGNSIQDASVKLNQAATAVGTDHSSGTFWPSALTWRSYGGAADLWGLTLAPADVNDSGFGAQIRVTEGIGDGAGYVASVDAVRMSIYYSTGPAVPVMAWVQTPDLLPAALPRQQGHVVLQPVLAPAVAWASAAFCTPPLPPAAARQQGYEVHSLEPTLFVAPPADSWDNQRPGPYPAALPRQQGYEVHTLEPTLFVAPPALSWGNVTFCTPAFPPAPARQQGYYVNTLAPSLIVPPPADAWDNQRPGPLPPALPRQQGLVVQSMLLPAVVTIFGPWLARFEILPAALPRQEGLHVDPPLAALLLAPMTWQGQVPGPLPPAGPRPEGTFVSPWQPIAYVVPADAWDNQRPDPLPPPVARQAGQRSEPLEQSLVLPPAILGWAGNTPLAGITSPARPVQPGFATEALVRVAFVFTPVAQANVLPPARAAQADLTAVPIIVRALPLSWFVQVPGPLPSAPARPLGSTVVAAPESSLVLKPPALSWWAGAECTPPVPPARLRQLELGWYVEVLEPGARLRWVAGWDNQKPAPLPPLPARQLGFATEALEPSLRQPPPILSWINGALATPPLPAVLPRQVGWFAAPAAPPIAVGSGMPYIQAPAPLRPAILQQPGQAVLVVVLAPALSWTGDTLASPPLPPVAARQLGWFAEPLDRQTFVAADSWDNQRPAPLPPALPRQGGLFVEPWISTYAFLSWNPPQPVLLPAIAPRQRGESVLPMVVTVLPLACSTQVPGPVPPAPARPLGTIIVQGPEPSLFRTAPAGLGWFVRPPDPLPPPAPRQVGYYAAPVLGFTLVACRGPAKAFTAIITLPGGTAATIYVPGVPGFPAATIEDPGASGGTET